MRNSTTRGQRRHKSTSRRNQQLHVQRNVRNNVRSPKGRKTKPASHRLHIRQSHHSRHLSHHPATQRRSTQAVVSRQFQQYLSYNGRISVPSSRRTTVQPRHRVVRQPSSQDTKEGNKARLLRLSRTTYQAQGLHVTDASMARRQGARSTSAGRPYVYGPSLTRTFASSRVGVRGGQQGQQSPTPRKYLR